MGLFLLAIGVPIAFIPTAIVVDLLNYTFRWGYNSSGVEHVASNILGIIFIIALILLVTFTMRRISKSNSFF